MPWSRLLLALLIVFSVASVASAQEIALTGPLKAAPGSGHTYWRRSRWAFAPSIGASVQSEGNASLVFGAEAVYHPAEWFGLGLYSHFSEPFEPARTDRHMVLALLPVRS